MLNRYYLEYPLAYAGPGRAPCGEPDDSRGSGGPMIELNDVINQLRDELERSITTARGRVLRFELETVELEVEVGIERSGEGNGKVRFWVAEVGAQVAMSRSSTQRVKLALKPVVYAHGTRSTAYVAGEAGTSEE
jgi:hypothetical protein